MTSAKLHPLIDGGVKQQADNGNGGKLRCKCKSKPVEVTLDSNVAFNHACKFNAIPALKYSLETQPELIPHERDIQ
jgi:hypothetical protein